MKHVVKTVQISLWTTSSLREVISTGKLVMEAKKVGCYDGDVRMYIKKNKKSGDGDEMEVKTEVEKTNNGSQTHTH